MRESQIFWSHFVILFQTELILRPGVMVGNYILVERWEQAYFVHLKCVIYVIFQIRFISIAILRYFRIYTIQSRRIYVRHLFSLQIHQESNSLLSKLIKQSYHGKMETVSLDGDSPIQMLLEIGVDKMKRDYISYFVGMLATHPDFGQSYPNDLSFCVKNR